MFLIAALDRNHAIGRDGGMPWRLPDDLRRFKRLTLGLPVLMGYRTAVSIGRALPGRVNLVLSRSRPAPYPGQLAVRSLAEAAEQAGTGSASAELAVIGGAEVYALALPYAGRLELTLVDTVVAGADTLFPRFAADGWTEVARVHHAADARHAYAFDWVSYLPAR